MAKEAYPSFTVKFFYLNDCGHCNAFETYTIPLLENEFDEAITIEYYDMDEQENIDLYHEICSKLYFYDLSYVEDVPFFVMDGKFALLGYSSGEEKELVRDIQKALKNEPLGERLSGYRWEFSL